MQNKIIQLLVCTGFIMFYSSCSQVTIEEKKEVEMKEIGRTISSCIGWFKNKDFDLLFSVVVHDSNYISVHPTDRVIRGFEQFKNNSEIFKNPDFKYVRHELKELTINLSKSGGCGLVLLYSG